MDSKLDYHKFSRGDGCTEEGCKAKRWYIDVNGRKYCQKGHEQFGFTQTAADDDDWNSQGHGRTTRKKREVREKIQVVYSGKEATNLYLECYQMILWRQCHWLVKMKGFPSELETVVRDLWSLRARISYGEKDEEGYTSRTGTIGFSSTSEGENSDGAASFTSSRWSRRTSGKGRERLPKLIETLGTCYLGTLLLRLPTSLGEIYRWAARDEIIYTRAIKEIPLEMRRRLPAHYHAALEIHTPLRGSAIYGSVLELIEFYNIHVNLIFPPLNAPLLIEKHIQNLCLPIEIYPAVQRLAETLKIDFSYPILHKRNYGVLAYPEVQLMCLVVVATKLSHPFDDVERHPENDSDPTVAIIDWHKWNEVMAEKPVKGLRRGEEIHVTDMNILNMSKEAMDDYMDFFQHTFLDDRPAKMPEKILNAFPLEDLPPRPPIESDDELKRERLRSVQNSRIVQKSISTDVVNNDSVTRPGELYKRYRIAEELSEHARAFYEKASRIIGINLEALVRGVFQTEVNLENWRLAKRRRHLAEESDSLDTL
ncbi:hypothetical protein B0O99DRAFT_618376 [Bisporella sp. PMI_857]|nr:hypothetical protein B0O99DRAFT_618376 [Bisporella sp. PMI_857]